jgi:hypothetical protein
MSGKKRKLSSANTTGYHGVYKIGERFRAAITIDHKTKSLGTYDTPKEAALAFDRAVVQHKLPSSKLNYPDGLPIDDEDYDELMNPKKKRRLASTNTTGYNGVYKSGKRFKAQIQIDRTPKNLGTYDTPKEAALAFDRAVVQHKLSSSRLNYPDGLPIDDEDYEELMNPKKKRRLGSNNTTGYNGVYKSRKKFRAEIRIDGKKRSLGSYDTPKEAALAFDRAVVQHKLPSSKLNYPDGLPIDDEDYEELMHPQKKRRLGSTNTSGYTGVYKNRKRFTAQIKIDRKQKYLGSYDTPKEAALAYDRAVVQHKLSSSKLNFPNDYTTSSEDDESSEEESDDSSSSDSCHSSDDDESDEEEDAPEPSPVPEAQPQPQFVREPMLDQMVADAQNKKQEEEQQQVEVEEQHVDVEEEDSGCDSDSFWL